MLYEKIRRYNWKGGFVRLLLTSCNFFRVKIYKVFLSDSSVDIRRCRILHPTQFIGKGKIYLNSCNLGVWPSPYFMSSTGYIEARGEASKVSIGSGTYINNAFVIICDKTSIHIGQRCLIGFNFIVCDSDFHGIELADRMNGNYECFPVTIDDDVFIGCNVKILKGVSIGRGAVIASGSVVTKDVPPFSVFAGVPAKLIKQIK